MARTYFRDSKGRFAKQPGGGAVKAAKKALSSVGNASAFSGPVQVLNGGKITGTISRAEAGRRMHGVSPAKLASPAQKVAPHLGSNGENKGTVSRAAAAAIMFGSKEAKRKLANSAKKRKK